MFYDARQHRYKLFESNNYSGINYFIKNIEKLKILMIVLYKCFSIKITEKIFNPIIVFAANFKVFEE